MKHSIIRKIPMGKKVLLFLDMDIVGQLPVLAAFFVFFLLVGWLLQLFADIRIFEAIITAFCLIVVILSIPSDEKIEIMPCKDLGIRYLKMTANIVLGCVYFGCLTILITRLLHCGAQFLPTDDPDTLACYYTLTGLICFLLTVWLFLFKFKHKLFLELPQAKIIDVHYMYVEKKDFVLMENEQKNIEFRLADIKRKRIKIGDVVRFISLDKVDKSMDVEVKNLYYAADFAELLTKTDFSKSGYINLTAALEELNKRYSPRQQKWRSVIGIEFQKLQS